MLKMYCATAKYVNGSVKNILVPECEMECTEYNNPRRIGNMTDLLLLSIQGDYTPPKSIIDQENFYCGE